MKYGKIGNYLKNSQYGISKTMNEDDIGYPIYRMNEIHNMLTDLEVNKYVDANLKELDTFCLKNQDVLFNRTNSYEWVGRTGIYYNNNNNVPHMFASYLVRFVPDQHYILPEYLTAFLNTIYGVKALKRRARESINQTNINPEEVKEIEIPLLNLKTQKIIQNNFISANELRIKSKKLYQEAENLLLEELGLINYKPTKKSASTMSFSSSFLKSGRLDAEYYQPKYDEIIDSFRSYKQFSEVINLYDTSYIPDFEKQYNYIELSDIGSEGNITSYMFENGKNLPTRARRKVKKDQVIVSSIEGSLNKCAIINSMYDNSLCSTGFYVIDSNYINSETLLVLFKLDPMQEILKQACSGTILTSINKDDLLNIPIPKIDDSIQEKILYKMQDSFKLKEKSEKLLKNSIRAIELAIENDETTANQWLQNLEKEVEYDL